jgi:hypothetical protein
VRAGEKTVLRAAMQTVTDAWLDFVHASDAAAAS